MKLIVKKQILEEIEITFPYFFKSGVNFCALLTEENAIILTFSHMTKEIRFFNNSEYVLLIHGDIEKSEITEQNFFAKYDEANKTFKNTISKWI